MWQQITTLSDEAWPEYNVHGEVISQHWPLLYERFADYQFVLYDDELDAVLAEGQTIPCAWDGTLDGLGPAIDDTIINAFALHESGGRRVVTINACRRSCRQVAGSVEQV